MNDARILSAVVSQALAVALVFVVFALMDALLARRGNVRWRSILWAVFWIKLALPVSFADVSLLGAARWPGAVERALALPAVAWTPSSSDSTAMSVLTTAVVGLFAGVPGLLLARAVVRAVRERRAWLHGTDGDVPEDLRTMADALARRSGLARTPRLRVRRDVESAAAVGLVDPVVVVSTRFLSPQRRSELEHVLLHEFAHVARRDAWRSVVWTMARCVYWFHPCVHAAAARAALLREMACDERAAALAGDGGEAYRRTLLELARPLAGAFEATDLSLSSVSFLGSRAQIVARLEGLARPRARRAGVSRARRFDPAGAGFLVVLCACCVPLGAAVPAHDTLANVADAQGCLRKRFLVMDAMAKDSVDAPDPVAPTHVHQVP